MGRCGNCRVTLFQTFQACDAGSIPATRSSVNIHRRVQILAGGQCEHIRYAAGAFYLHAARWCGPSRVTLPNAAMMSGRIWRRIVPAGVKSNRQDGCPARWCRGWKPREASARRAAAMRVPGDPGRAIAAIGGLITRCPTGRAGVCQLRKAIRKVAGTKISSTAAYGLRAPFNLLETLGLNLRRFTASVAGMLVSAELGRLVNSHCTVQKSIPIKVPIQPGG